ncbi:hypothetical protein FSARC_7226 [Fusarium sarcochroum]|uniref:Uncharacterized protein n=1 Tax=Fusarium sarcochroum TaxID=1208366 RepID=A0A8H4TVH1_9HYPO|nr:hypothetical protein FSARC_7226 [Fusarium sarcochroum]
MRVLTTGLFGATMLASVTTATTAKIGYISTLVPDPTGGLPSPGCGLVVGVVEDNGQLHSYWFGENGKDQPIDACPGADVKLFCERWGCPYKFDFNTLEQDPLPVVLQVNSDSHIDNSISVDWITLGDGQKTVKCNWVTDDTTGDPDSAQIHWTWHCDV